MPTKISAGLLQRKFWYALFARGSPRVPVAARAFSSKSIPIYVRCQQYDSKFCRVQFILTPAEQARETGPVCLGAPLLFIYTLVFFPRAPLVLSPFSLLPFTGTKLRLDCLYSTQTHLPFGTKNKTFGVDHPQTRASAKRLVQIYDAQQGGRKEEAAELRADPQVRGM